jgi:hypothetical protein
MSVSVLLPSRSPHHHELAERTTYFCFFSRFPVLTEGADFETVDEAPGTAAVKLQKSQETTRENDVRRQIKHATPSIRFCERVAAPQEILLSLVPEEVVFVD